MRPEDVAARGQTAKGKRQVGLQNEVANWATPIAGKKGPGGPRNHGGQTIGAQANSWATPNARDWKGEDIPGRAGAPSLPAQAMRKAGQDGLPLAVLNPLFVEALMGLPIGWTNCGVLATPSSPRKRRPRSSSSPGGTKRKSPEPKPRATKRRRR